MAATPYLQRGGLKLVLVWCNPIKGGRRRTRLDQLLLAAAVDRDFLLGERDPAEERYVLCEVNVSSVSPVLPPLASSIKHQASSGAVGGVRGRTAGG